MFACSGDASVIARSKRYLGRRWQVSWRVLEQSFGLRVASVPSLDGKRVSVSRRDGTSRPPEALVDQGLLITNSEAIWEDHGVTLISRNRMVLGLGEVDGGNSYSIS